MFEGAVGDLSVQVHDFEPGIKPSGLFWTIPIPPSAVEIAPDAGTARYRMTGVAVPDFHDFLNAISPSPASRPGHVSFDVAWARAGDRQSIRDETFGFTGTYIPSSATVAFAAADDGTGVVYASDPGGQTVVSAGVGRERNGVFFF